MDELKKCPFCGALPISTGRDHVSTSPCYVLCEECGATQRNYATVDDAIAAWNTRTPREGAERDDHA
jgi:Lar family restriction alleviation protein